VATCAVCGYEAAGSFRFCPECGARGDGRAREQRKIVTVLFCDVAGSTALGESLDAEALRALLARYFERMKSIVERHGGAVEKFIGDAVMAVFGLPAVHEDDAVRALQAAAEMQLALPSSASRDGSASTAARSSRVPRNGSRRVTPSTLPRGWSRPRNLARSCSETRHCDWLEMQSRRNPSNLCR
jgi:hypothetical protein